MKMIKLECSNCGAWFERKYRADQGMYPTQYCSKECLGEARRTTSTLVRECRWCDSLFTPNQIRQKFCTQKCAAIFNNTGRRRHGNDPGNCLRCEKQLSRSTQTYCSIECREQHKLELWLSGEVVPSTKWCSVPAFIRRYLMEQCSNTCSKCGWAKVHPVTGLVPLQI